MSSSAAVAAAALLDALPDTVVVADRHGHVAYVNPAVTALLGHDPEELVGQSLTVLMPARLRHGHGTGFARYRATGEGKLVGATTQVPALHADGSEVAVALTLSRLVDEDPDGAFVVAVLRDASSTILLERQMAVSRFLSATLRVTAALAEARDADEAFRQLLPSLCEHLDWDAAGLWRPEPTGARLAHAGTWQAPGQEVPALREATERTALARGEGLAGLAWQATGPVVIPDLWTEPAFVRSEAARRDGIRTGVALPVLAGDTVVAVVELFSRQRREVSPELLDVLASAGRQIGQYLARLRAESVARGLADTLQRSLLPPRLPTVPGLDLAARYLPGGEGVMVGGDTYDVAPLPDGRWMVLVADVCGKGAEAAAMTALARHTARAVAADGGPAHVLAAVNAALLAEEHPGPLRFVTACCLVVEPHAGGARAVLALAGHPRPLLRGCDGAVTEVGTTSLPLGVEADLESPEVTLHQAPRPTHVLYTDGITEARDAGGVQFGEDGLSAVLRDTSCRSAEQTVEAVHRAVSGHLAGSQYDGDDRAVLAIRC